MKISKIFLPNRDLKKSIDQLLEGRKKIEGDPIIDEEAEKLFPNFIDFLKNEYGPVVVEKIPQEYKKQWDISLQVKDNKVEIGSIQSYVKEKSLTSEYGFEAEVIIQAKLINLTYRVGYHGYDSLGSIVSDKDPCRYDSENIPFP